MCAQSFESRSHIGVRSEGTEGSVFFWLMRPLHSPQRTISDSSLNPSKLQVYNVLRFSTNLRTIEVSPVISMCVACLDLGKSRMIGSFQMVLIGKVGLLQD